MKRVVMAMSGGVDSSVGAALLKEGGYDVIGVYILGWTGTEEFPCNWQNEEADARAVAKQLSIPFYTVNLSKEYEKLVIEEFFNGYRKGLTPNPDILCNREIKFKALWEAVRQFEPDFLATGHYAQIDHDKEHAVLKGADLSKDQTYFLWGIDKQILPYILFPVGGYKKTEIRQLAEKFNLPTAKKRDSQGICFVGPLKVREFLRSYTQPKEGDAVLKDGRVIGKHQGVQLYTIGQRLGAGAVDWTGDVPPLFVIAKDLKTNVLVVGTDEQTYATEFVAGQANWLTDRPEEKFEAWAKVRYRQDDIAVNVDTANGQLHVTCKEPVRALTPGQSVVFYDGDRIIGGAIIETVREQLFLLEHIYGQESQRQ